jgi:dipeptidyl aminopeptidase/acylaminoacyl peptidase
MMTYLALQQSGIFKAAVISNGVTNMIRSAAKRPNMEHNVYAQCIPNYWENRREELKKRSVIFWVDELPCNTSYLILCGTQDTLVSPAHSRNVAKKLERMDYDVEFHEFETDHKFSNKKDELYDLLLNWFNEKLCDFVPEDL